MAGADDEALPAKPAQGDGARPLPCGGCGCADRDDGPAEAVPDWRDHVDFDRLRRMDVRPMLAVGEAPFAAVMRMAEDVAAGGFLMIEAPFDPQPLRRVLAAEGFLTYGERLGPSHWRIWGRRDEPRDRLEQAGEPRAGARIWRSGDVVHIDVRGLEAPGPLVAILALIDGGGHDGHVVVHHEREPLYLYPELEDRGWRYRRLPSPEGEVRLELLGPPR